MGILSFIKNLLGSDSENQNRQSFSSENEVKAPLNTPNLGKGFHAEDIDVQEDVSPANNGKGTTSEEVKPSTPKSAAPSCEGVKENLGTPEKKEKTPRTIATYNLIILDESGSMSTVRNETISGCNETLNSIRNTAKENKEIRQYVSIFCFDTTNSRYLFHDVPVEETRDLTSADYCPNACTPLYDAIGYTVTQLSRLLANSDSVGVVTIITDGYENASRLWKHHMVVQLIENLKKRGWVFTFIGANIDVEGTASGLGIDSRMRFNQTASGMKEMFGAESRSRRAYSSKLDYLRKMEERELRRGRYYGEEQRRADLGSLNRGYFVEESRIAPDFIDKLANADVFVFGSNIHGQHHGGASLYALEHFGAINGQAEGMQGRSYAIPTEGNTFEELKQAIERFNDYVVTHPHVRFMLSAIGCGSAGYSVEQIAPLFYQAYSFGNVYVPKQFLPYMSTNPNVEI